MASSPWASLARRWPLHMRRRCFIPNPIEHDLRSPKAGERPNGRRGPCREAKRADARAGV